MIASLTGTVEHVGLDHLVVDVGGVGLLVHTTATVAAGHRTGGPARLATSLVVREDSLTLYGFADTDERDIFGRLTTVSGVGPRLALAVLSVHAADSVRLAIARGDVGALTKVPGIGKKSAERLILELKDKIGASTGDEVGTGSPALTHGDDQVKEALVGLGWSAKHAEDALASLAGTAADGAPTAERLKAALRVLGR